MISAWHDREITTGREWACEIADALDRCKVILLLVIPRALIADRSGPLAAGDRGQAVGRRHEPVPGLAAGRDDGLVVRPDPQAELVLPQVLPHVLDRVQLGAVARQRQEGEVLGDGEA